MKRLADESPEPVDQAA